MTEDKVFTIYANGPYTNKIAHKININFRSIEDYVIIFAKKISGEFEISDISIDIYKFLEEKYQLDEDKFYLVLDIDQFEFYNIVYHQKIYSIFENSPKCRLSSKYIKKNELNNFISNLSR